MNDDAHAWPLIEIAARRGYDTRAGLEDTLTPPGGSPAEDNAALVSAATRMAAQVACAHASGLQASSPFESSSPPE